MKMKNDYLYVREIEKKFGTLDLGTSKIKKSVLQCEVINGNDDYPTGTVIYLRNMFDNYKLDDEDKEFFVDVKFIIAVEE